MRIPSIGELNKRVRLREREDWPVDETQVEPIFPSKRDRWAKIEPVGASVYANSVQIDRRITHRIFMRYLEGITDAFEVVYRGRVYRVRRVGDVNGVGRFTVLEVEEIGNGE